MSAPAPNARGRARRKRKTKQQPPRQQAARQPVQAKPKEIGPRLAACSHDYANSLANPFADGPLACIPSYPPLLTRKTKVWTRGTFETSSTTGFGYIVACPWLACQNDMNSTVWSLATFTNSFIVTGADPNTGRSPTNAPYGSSSFSPSPPTDQVTARVVSSGLRIRYIGTELNRGGQVVALLDPSHDDMGGRTMADFLAERESKKFAVERDWITVLYKPFLREELDFTNSQPAPFIMGFIVQAPVGVTAPFEFEFYTNLEYEGKIVRSKTPSHADPVGFSAISTAALTSPALNPTTKTSSQRTGEFMNNALTAVEHSATSTANFIQRAAKTATTVYHAGQSIAKVARPLLALI